MRPQGLTGVTPTVSFDEREDLRGSACLARAHLQAHQGSENFLRGTARRAAPTHHLAQRVRVRQVGQRRAGSDDLDPALDESQHGFQARESTALIGRHRQRKHAAAERRLNGRGVRGIHRAGRLRNSLRVDRDLRRVALDRAHEITFQPWHGCKETPVGSLAHSQELAHLIEGRVQAVGELRDVVGQQGSVRGVRQGDARVVGAKRLAGQGAQGARELRGEHHRRQAGHHLLRLAEHRRHPVGQGHVTIDAALAELLGERAGQGARHVECYGFADALPRGDRVLNPRDLAPHVAGDGTGRKVRDGVQPQVSDRHRLARCFGLGRRRGLVAAHVGGLLGAVFHDAPVHRPGRRVHEELQLTQGRLHASGVGKLGRQVRRIEALGLKSAGGLGGCLVSQDGAQEILKGGARLVLIHGHRLAGGR